MCVQVTFVTVEKQQVLHILNACLYSCQHAQRFRRITRVDSKIPGIVKKNYLKCMYKFETLVPFEVLPLRLDAVIPAPLPMLET